MHEATNAVTVIGKHPLSGNNDEILEWLDRVVSNAMAKSPADLLRKLVWDRMWEVGSAWGEDPLDHELDALSQRDA